MIEPLRPRRLLPRISGILLLFLFLGAPATAAWIDGADPDPRIPDPDTFLGRPFAERHTTVDELFAYARELAAVSDRVEIERMGTSVQGDPLLLLVITDPSNRPALAHRDSLMSIVRDPWSHPRAERERVAAALLPATWIACSVHGDEASGSDAGIYLAYHLASDRSPATRAVLRRSIVLIGPSHNPDGRRRFLQHVRSFGRQVLAADPSPWAAEHWQSWPGGRTNHFLFDLNRDWAFLTQQETRSHVAAYLRWRPQVFVDLHEMGRQSSYFFPPPADPINPNIPREHLRWFDVFGQANAEAFDAKGYDYFVREDFDLFYPGYGDSWPTLQGAVGMTYEQATTRGRALEQRGGRIVGYAEAVAHHLTAAWTTVQTAALHADGLMSGTVDYFEESRQRASRDERKEIVLSVARHGAEAARLAGVLAKQGIEVFRTTEDARLPLRPYDGGRPRRVDLPAGSFRVPLEQPAYALVRSLLDPHTEMDEQFLEQERERHRRGLNSRFYDVTAWSLVYSYGVEAWTATRRLRVASERVLPTEAQPWKRLARLPDPAEEEARAWVIPYRDNAALGLLPRLWSEDIVVECALSALEIEGRTLPRGSLVIKRASNAVHRGLGARLRALASESGVELYALQRTWTESGPSLGSGRTVLLTPPRVAMLTGPGVSPSSAGGLSWLLEDRYRFAFTTVLLQTLDRIDLGDFDVLLVPELRKPEEFDLARLEPWVRDGGILIVVGAATQAVVAAGDDWTSVERVEDLADLVDDDGRLGEIPLPKGPAEEEGAGPLPPERRPLRTPGAIVRLDLDPTHYLTLGETEVAYAPLLSDRILMPSVAGRNVARIDPENPRRAGFMWPVMEEALRDKAFVVEESHRRGRVILFAEDPGFRGTWEGLHRLLLNGLLLGPSLVEVQG